MRTEPQGVAALDRARRLDPADRRDPVDGRPGLDRGRLDTTVGLARAQRDRATVRDEQRIERVDEVGALGLSIEHVDRRAERGEQLREGGVLALRDREVAGMQEAMGWIVEGSPERRARRLEQGLMQRRRHALAAEDARRGLDGGGHQLTRRRRAARRSGPALR
jgi:hypothetical protein